MLEVSWYCFEISLLKIVGRLYSGNATLAEAVHVVLLIIIERLLVVILGEGRI